MGYSRDSIKLRTKQIEDAILKDPTLTNEQLVQRYGCNRDAISKIRKRVKVLPPASEYVTQSDLNKTRQICEGFNDNVFRFGRWMRTKESS